MINVESEKGFFYKNPQDYLDGKINDLCKIDYEVFGVQIHDDIYRDETSGWGMHSAHFLGKNGITMTKEEMTALIENKFINYDYPFCVKKLKPSLTWRERGNIFPIEDLKLLEKLEEENSWRPNYWIRDTDRPLDASLSYPVKEKSPEPKMHVVVDEFKKKAHPIDNRKDLPEYLVVCVRFFVDSWNASKKEHKKADEFSGELLSFLRKAFGDKAKTWSHSDSKSTSKIINGEILTSVKDINGKECKIGDRVYHAPAAGVIKEGIITKFTDISIFIDDVCCGFAQNYEVIKID